MDWEVSMALENWPFNRGVGVGAVTEPAKATARPVWPWGNPDSPTGPYTSGRPSPFCVLLRVFRVYVIINTMPLISFLYKVTWGVKAGKVYMFTTDIIIRILLISCLKAKMWNCSYTEGHCMEELGKVPGSGSQVPWYQACQRDLWITEVASHALKNMER